MVESLLSSRAEREPWSEAGGELVDVNRRNERPKTTWWGFQIMLIECYEEYCYHDGFNDGDSDDIDDELDQVEDAKCHEMSNVNVNLWLQAETIGVTYFGAYNRPPDGHF